MTVSQFDVESEITSQGVTHNITSISNHRKRKYLHASPYPLVRRGPYKRTSTTGGPVYFSKDNTKLKVVMYLFSLGKGANRNKMLHDSAAGLRGQEWGRFAVILDSMCDDGWLTKTSSDDAENVTVYRLTEKGKEVALKMKELRDKQHPLLEIDAFFDIKS